MARGLYLNEIEKIKKIPEGKGGSLVDTVEASRIALEVLETHEKINLGCFDTIEDLMNYINIYYGGIDNLPVGSKATISFYRAGLVGEKGLTEITIEKGS